MQNDLPEGYDILSVGEDKIVVGIDFRHIGGTSVPYIVYEGREYVRGMIETVPLSLANSYCSLREYMIRK